MRWRYIKQGKVSHPKKTTEKSKKFIAAPIKDRLKAFLTDTFMITMPIFYIVIYLVMGSREEFRAHMAQGWLYILIPHYLIVTTLWSLKGQTPGMKAYDMKLVRLNDRGLPNFFQATIRYIAMPISILSIVGVAIALFGKERLTLYDYISFTGPIHIDES